MLFFSQGPITGSHFFGHYHLAIGPWKLRVQDAMTLESRSKAIPLPKAKPAPIKPGAKTQAKAKAKAKAAPHGPDGDDQTNGGGRRASKKR